LVLATDPADEVRTDVASKIAELTVQIAGGKRDNVYHLTMEALEILARDQLVRVRRILAEALKDCPQAPVDVMESLALDREISVCEPVLESCPVLQDDFLIKVIHSDPVQGALSAIARRVVLGENVADAIVYNGDAEAIAELLGNDSAQIREETLDRIVDQASGQPTWHKPLVHRPNLHAEAAVRIAEIVATPLLAELRNRTELDEKTIASIKEIILRRIDADDFSELFQADARAAENEPAPESPVAPTQARKRGAGPDTDLSDKHARESVVYQRVLQMFEAGELNETELTSALSSGGQEFVIDAIALMSKRPVEVVSRAISMRSAKAIVALCWRADLSMRLATRIQMNLANIPPRDVLRATKSGDFPLSRDEMRWQLEFIAGLASST